MALAAVWLAFVIAALVLSLRRRALLPFAAFLLALCVQLPLIILTRPSLTQQLGEYTTTFPDRYFIPANSLVIVTSVIAISILVQCASRAPRIAGLLTGGSLVAFYAMNMDPLFEGRQPRYQIMLGLSFEDQICVAADPSDSLNNETLAIPIYFAGWTMEVPSHVVSDNIAHKSCLNRFRRFPPDDENWDRGISRTAPILVVPNLRSFREDYAVGRTVTLRDGESRRIVEQAQFNPEYLWVTLSGDPFSREKAGPIHEFKVSN